MKPIYMDNAASTPVKPEVLAKFNEVAENMYGNPSSMHDAGIEAYTEIENVKDLISKKINCEPDEIYFTSGATMSNNILIQGVLRKKPECSFITSMVEHNDIMELYDWLPYSKHIINVDTDGIIKLDELWKEIASCENNNKPCLISIQMANSETGVIQPIEAVSSIVHEYGGYLHVDATQYIPYYPIDVKKLNIDALSMSGQKIGGIKGSGLLYISNKMIDDVSPIIFGEQGLVGGTYPTPLISSLGKAFELLNYDNDELKNKRDVLLDKLVELGGELIGDSNNRLINNIYIRFPNVKGLVLQSLLNERGIYIGTGSACSSDSDKPSHVALAYGLTEEEAFECVRFTLSNDISYEDIDMTVDILKRILCLL